MELASSDSESDIAKKKEERRSKRMAFQSSVLEVFPDSQQHKLHP